MNELWSRIESACVMLVPSLAAAFREGIDEGALVQFERQIKQRLSDDVRQAYLRHDGCTLAANARALGFFGTYRWLPLEEVAERWSWHGSDFGDEDPYFYDDSDGQWDNLPVRPWQSTPPCWIPIAACMDSPATIYVDLEPGPLGSVGQLVATDVDSMSTSVFASSLASFLEDLVNGFDSNSLTVRTDQDTGQQTWWYADGRPFVPRGNRSVW